MISLSTPFSFETASTTIRISLFIAPFLAAAACAIPARGGSCPPRRNAPSPLLHPRSSRNPHLPCAPARPCSGGGPRAAPQVPHGHAARRNPGNAPACAGGGPCPARTRPEEHTSEL